MQIFLIKKNSNFFNERANFENVQFHAYVFPTMTTRILLHITIKLISFMNIDVTWLKLDRILKMNEAQA